MTNLLLKGEFGSIPMRDIIGIHVKPSLFAETGRRWEVLAISKQNNIVVVLDYAITDGIAQSCLRKHNTSFEKFLLEANVDKK